MQFLKLSSFQQNLLACSPERIPVKSLETEPLSLTLLSYAVHLDVSPIPHSLVSP
jgi:hypothetical protein